VATGKQGGRKGSLGRGSQQQERTLALHQMPARRLYISAHFEALKGADNN
jgi:hypothetical protein